MADGAQESDRVLLDGRKRARCEQIDVAGAEPHDHDTRGSGHGCRTTRREWVDRIL